MCKRSKRHTSYTVNLDWSCICQKPHLYDWNILTAHVECTLAVVSEYKSMPWRLMTLLEKDKEYLHIASNIWSKLEPSQKTSRLSWQIISQVVPYDYGFLSKYRQFLDWNILSRRKDIEWRLVQKTYRKKHESIHQKSAHSHLPWVFGALSKNNTLSLPIVSSMLDAADSWNESRLVHKFRLRPDYFTKFLPAVQTIQEHWLRAYYDPMHTSGICARRLTRQVDEDSDSIKSASASSSITGTSPVNQFMFTYKLGKFST